MRWLQHQRDRVPYRDRLVGESVTRVVAVARQVVVQLDNRCGEIELGLPATRCDALEH